MVTSTFSDMDGSCANAEWLASGVNPGITQFAFISVSDIAIVQTGRKAVTLLPVRILQQQAMILQGIEHVTFAKFIG